MAEPRKQINGEALRGAVLAKYPTLTKANEELGRSRGFLGQIIYEGSIADHAIVSIDKTLGIAPEKYVIFEEPAVQEETQLEIDPTRIAYLTAEITALKQQNEELKDQRKKFNDLALAIINALVEAGVAIEGKGTNGGAV